MTAVKRPGVRISTHALREEGDCPVPAANSPAYHFYPRPPRGGRPDLFIDVFFDALFLPTPSARRATPGRPGLGRQPQHFYPRPPRGGRLSRRAWSTAGWCISTHALREEGDDRRRVL